MMHLKELDKIEISVLVNNEVDYLSPSPHPEVKHAGHFAGPPLAPLASDDKRAGAAKELRMDGLCCGAHGLSLVITAVAGDTKHTILFDAGPEEDVFERNVSRSHLDPSIIEHVHLSHWHRDHSGGLLRALKLISEARHASGQSGNLTVGLHPDRPDYRGFNARGAILSLERDPSFEEIETAGGTLMKSDTSHTILDDAFLVSGEVPRRTDYEVGIPNGMRLNEASGEWEKDEEIKDERFVMCNLKGKGLVVFAGCSHPGIVNICKNALELGGGAPLYAVVGGFHLADGDPTKMQRSIDDLKALKPSVLMTGHCTGWRFNFKIEKEMPGSLVPCFGGSRYILDA